MTAPPRRDGAKGFGSLEPLLEGVARDAACEVAALAAAGEQLPEGVQQAHAAEQ